MPVRAITRRAYAFLLNNPKPIGTDVMSGIFTGEEAEGNL
jgi:hypothetical protein